MGSKDCAGKRDYDTATIKWNCVESAQNCTVEVRWYQQLIMHAVLSATNPAQSFSASLEDEPDQTIKGDFVYGPGACMLTLTQFSVGGTHYPDQVLCPVEPPIPPDPPVPPDPEPVEDISATAVNETGSDLFPYVFLRDWPSISARERRDRFVEYTATTCVTDDPRLYCRLLTIDRAAPDARTKLVDEGVSFIEGQSPYEGQYAARATDLVGLAGKLAGLSVSFSREWALTIDRFITQLCESLNQTWTQIVTETLDPVFLAQVDRAWQNVFAQNLVLGYDRAGAQQMVRTVTFASLLQRMVASLPPVGLIEGGMQPIMPLPPAEYWTPERIREGLNATVILPVTVFPLPALQHESAPMDEPVTRRGILPYAVGMLQLARRALIGYEAGEVAQIENVMAGERKISTQRERVSEAERQEQRFDSLDDARNRTQGRATSFDEQAQKILNERYRVDYETNYGPPAEATAKGFWKVTPETAGTPNAERDLNRSTLAREITTQAARRLSQEVSVLRVRELSSEREWSQRHSFDRRDASAHLRGIYRWVNAIYECWVTQQGERFVLELFVPKPANNFIAAQFDLAGVDLSEPPSPGDLGVHTFSDVSLDPASPQYYAKLAAAYGYDHFEPPPPPSLTAGATFESGAPLGMQVLALADGYAAADATVALSASATGFSVKGTIGNAAFALTDADTLPKAVTLAGQTHALPIALTVIAPAPAVDGDVVTTTTPPSFALAIEINATLTTHAVDRWKATFYAGWMASYRRRQERYLEAAGVKHGAQRAPNTLAWRTAVRQELKRQGLRELVAVSRKLTGEYGRAHRFLPALLVFFERALEWGEMSYSFLVDLDADGRHLARRASGEDEAMTAFLQASYARVLLPVTPGFERTLAYYLASGMIWDGEDQLAPTFDVPITAEGGATTTFVDLVDDLKRVIHEAPRQGTPLKPIRDTWKVIVPTTMTILQDGQELPRFKLP